MRREKQLTTYAIANHLLAKSLITLQYYREAKVFLGKASTIVSKALSTRKLDLQAAIGNDVAQLGRIMRSFADVQAVPSEAEIVRALTTIKTDLATQTATRVEPVSAEAGTVKTDQGGGDIGRQQYVLANVVEQEQAQSVGLDRRSGNQEEIKSPARSPQRSKVTKTVAEKEQERDEYLKHVNLTSEELQLEFMRE